MHAASSSVTIKMDRTNEKRKIDIGCFSSFHKVLNGICTWSETYLCKPVQGHQTIPPQTLSQMSMVIRQ